MTKAPDDKTFMREKIVKPKPTSRQIAGKIICLLFVALIFGIVSAVGFVVSKPLAEKYLGYEEEPSSVPITIERDDEPVTTEAIMETETMEQTAPEPSQEPNLDDIRNIVQEELAQTPWTLEKMKEFNQVLRNIGTDAERSIVMISSVRHQVDWFDNPVEKTGQYAGIILAVNENEVVVLASVPAIEHADSLRISFGDGSSASAEIKQVDSVTEMAVLSIQTIELTETTKNWIQAIELGNSYSVGTGDMILAVGSPANHVYSVKQGLITYVAKGIQTTDGQTRVLYTDMICSQDKGTFFLNLSGQLIGWATNLYDSDGTTDITKIMSISEYKGNLQKLSNGIPIPYMGIYAQDVNTAMQTEGIPKGIYITESIVDGPAYLAGIQNGDILTSIQGEPIATIRDFQSRLEMMQEGMEISVMIERKGIDEYKQIEYRVTIGAR